MNRAKSYLVLAIILLSLLPVYFLYKYLQRVMRPRESPQRFLLWMISMFILIFVYSFLVVFLVKRIFPEA